MIRTIEIDDTVYERFINAVSQVYNGRARGNVAHELREAIKDRIKFLEAQKK